MKNRRVITFYSSLKIGLLNLFKNERKRCSGLKKKYRVVYVSGKIYGWCIKGTPEPIRVQRSTQWRLEHVSPSLAAADWLDVRRVHQTPKVIGVVAAVQAETQARSHHAHHRGDGDRSGVAGVASLELHAHLEVVGGRDPGLQTRLGYYHNRFLPHWSAVGIDLGSSDTPVPDRLS